MKSLPLAFLVILFVIVGFSSEVGAQCEPTTDCNSNGIADSCDIAENTCDDCDGNGVPDECQISDDPSVDCNQDSILDSCESSLEDILIPSSTSEGFADSADMTETWLALGAPESEISGQDAGAVHIYRNIGSRWVEETVLTAPDPDDGAEFGTSVSLSGNQMIIGSPGRDGGSSQGDLGAAYIYRHDGTNWNFEQKIEASNGTSNSEFGIAVGISGDKAVVGAWAALSNSNHGAAYIFSFDGNTWSEDQIIQSNDPDAEKEFGGAVAIDGDYIAISDKKADLGFLDHVGAVYLYTSITPTNWIFTQKLTAQDPQSGAEFGNALDLSGTNLLVGSPLADSANGAAYHFERTSFVYSQSAKLSEGLQNAQLGIDVAITGDCLIAGAWRANSNTGRVFLYEQDSSGSYTSSGFTPASTQSGHRFGSAVAGGGRWCLGASLTAELAITDRLIDLPDCNQNGVDDSCDIFLEDSNDCNLDGVPDSCQVASGEVSDCNLDGIPDQCQLDDGSEPDCNANGVVDSCDIASGNSPDCNVNAIPDDCETDCNFNGIADSCELTDGLAFDCDGNGTLDECDIAFGLAADCNSNAIPDSCDIQTGVAEDCDGSEVLDVCEILLGLAEDCNSNGNLDLCEIAIGTSEDCNSNAVPDICDIATLTSPDCNGNLSPDECELSDGSQPDCNTNGVIDSCDIAGGTSGDCDFNGNPDECDVALGAVDCDGNLVPDVCEVDVDLSPPTIVGLPDGIVIPVASGTCETVVTWDDPTIEDDCGVGSVTQTHFSGDTFSLGATEVSVVVTDVSGNVTGHTFEVTVVDDQFPVIESGPVDIQLDNIPGECEAIATWDEPVASDNCAVLSFNSTFTSGTSFPVGNTLVTYVAEDSSGNTTSHSFNVVVDDVDLPSIQGLPGTVIVNTNPGLCTALVSWASPAVEDNCPGSTVSSSHAPGDAFPVGITLITYTATDAQGNQSESSFEMTVIDDEQPVVTGVPSNVVLENDPGSCGAIHEWIATEASDNCGDPAITLSHQSGDLYQVGSTEVTMSVDDGNGNILNFSFIVVVNDTEAPAIGRMPEDITVNAEEGLCTSVVDWELPEATDNCEAATLVANHQPGADYSVGTTAVTYTATDIHGNITLESFNVTVVDDQVPAISGLPADLMTDSTPGLCGATVAWALPVVDDNCGILSVETTNEAGTVFVVGTTTVTYTVTDVNNNVTEDSFLVVIEDVEHPVITNMPADILLTNEVGSCGAAATWEIPDAGDNCSVSNLESDHQSGDQFPVGTTVVTYTATDASGLQSTESFQVVVEDTEIPTITGLVASLTFSNSDGFCNGVAVWDAPTASDNCSIESLTSTHESGWNFSVGDTLVTYTATDIHNNQSTETFIVTIVDLESPTFTNVPISITIPNEPGLCSAVATWDTPVPVDNCQVMSLGTSHLSGFTFDVGVTQVSYTAMDIYGNTAEYAFTVTIQDTEFPEIQNVPLIVEVDAEPGLCTAVASWNDPTPVDNCGILNYESSHSSGDVFPVGTTTVTLTAEDSAFNVSTSSFDVVVTDTQDPVILNMPEDIQLSSELGLCSALASWTAPSGEDNCAVESLVSSHDSDTYFVVGTTEVTITLTDIHGNIAQDVMLVTVTDVENPQIVNLPDRVTITTEPGICQGTTSWQEPDTSDNCAVESLVASVASGSMLPVGETEVVYTVTDIHQNSSSQSFIVTVEDQELPVISNVPADANISNDVDQCGAIVTWDAPIASDNCSIESLISTHSSGDFFDVGTTEVMITATDIYSNSDSTTFLITVTDDQDPQISGLPQDISITAEPGVCVATVTWTAPTASDNCIEVNLDSNHNPGDSFIVGITDVTYTAIDTHGNMSSGTFSVTVTDDEHPVLVALPGDISMTAEAGLCSSTVMWDEVQSTDNCGIESLSSDHQSGDSFPVGDTIVTYTTSDIHDNVTVGDFVITITDNENPEFVDLPERVTVNSEAGICSAAVLWSDPQAVDNCGVLSVTLDHASGEQFPVGDTPVTVVAEDIHGNLQSAEFIVSVVDQEVPQILNVPTDVVSGSDEGECGASITWEAPTAADNCAIATFVMSHESASFFEVGTTVVTLTAVDIHNNISSTAFLISIEDTENPMIAGLPAGLDYNSDPGSCSAVVDWDQPSVTDNCGIASTSSSHEPGATFPVGTTEVSYTAVDIHENVLTTAFLVTVTDMEAPQIIDLPDRITIPTEPGLCEGVAGWNDPETSDNCAVESLETNIASGTPLPVGETSVSYTVTDIHGNAVTESFIVTVEDQELPQIIGLSTGIDQSSDAGLCGATVTWTEPTTTDNCGVQSTETTHSSGDFFDVGTTEVTLTTIDIHGNTLSDSFVVTINDDEDPEISGLSQDLMYSSETGVCSATASWDDPTASDNCAIEEFTSSHLPGDTFPVGLSEVTYTATDVHGNQHSSSFSIVVVDDEFPSIVNVPGAITVSNDNGSCGATVEWPSAVALDNCSVLFYEESHTSGDFFPVGTTTVSISATDTAANVTSTSFTITVNDVEDPVLTNVPTDRQEFNSPGQCGTNVEWNDWSSSDNCEIASMESSYSSGDFFAVGSTQVVLIATDIYGNSDKATFTVIVTDSELPQINGTPTNLEVETDSGQCGAAVSWTEPSGSDNCGLETLESTHGNGGFFGVGTTEVVYVATDIHGNKQSSSFSISVIDTEYPIILNVPSNISVSNDTGACGAVVTWQKSASFDNCSIVNYEETHLSGTYFPVGTTPVTLAATDEAGNRTLAQFDVTVEDNETPELLNVPLDIAVDTDPGQCNAVVTWSAPGAQDNCDVVDLTSSHSSGTSFPIGDTTVIVLAEDQYGNQSAGSFLISVTDNENPQILNIPENITVVNDPGQCGATVEWDAPGSQDNCEGESIGISNVSGDFFAVGASEIRITVTDSSGNSVSDTFIVTVEDEEDPTIESSGDISIEATADTCNAAVSVPEPVGADNCSVASITNDYTGTGNASGTYELGTSVVTWTITDIHGNQSTTTQSITVTVDETDCNENGQPDVCEIASGSAEDCNTNGIPDECEADCNGNGTPDDCDINSGSSADANENGTPDECEQQFRRGDANTTGTIDVTDPIYILQYVIGTGPAPECMDSGDCNNDESLDISDAVYLLTHLFLGTTPPAAPNGSCGIDPDGVSIGCDSYPICP